MFVCLDLMCVEPLCVLGPYVCWAHICVGPLGSLGRLWHVLGRLWGCLGRSWEVLGRVLGCPWVALGRPWDVLCALMLFCDKSMEITPFGVPKGETETLHLEERKGFSLLSFNQNKGFQFQPPPPCEPKSCNFLPRLAKMRCSAVLGCLWGALWTSWGSIGAAWDGLGGGWISLLGPLSVIGAPWVKFGGELR